MNYVSLGEKQFREIRAVLSGNPCNQCRSHRFTVFRLLVIRVSVSQHDAEMAPPVAACRRPLPWEKPSDNLDIFLELSRSIPLIALCHSTVRRSPASGFGELHFPKFTFELLDTDTYFVWSPGHRSQTHLLASRTSTFKMFPIFCASSAIVVRYSPPTL